METKCDILKKQKIENQKLKCIAIEKIVWWDAPYVRVLSAIC